MDVNDKLDQLFDKLINITFCLEGDSKVNGMQFLWDRYGKELYTTHKELQSITQELADYYSEALEFQRKCDSLTKK